MTNTNRRLKDGHNRRRVSPAEFVTAWQESDSIAAVLRRLGLEPSSDNHRWASSKAHHLRSVRKVELKRLRTGHSTDWDVVRALATAKA